MHRRAVAERGQVIAAFQQGNHPAVAAIIGDVEELAGDPEVILGLHLELRQGIAGVGVEAGRDDDEFGIEDGERRDDGARIGLAERVRAGSGRQGDVADIVEVAAFIRQAGAGIAWPLVA